jgi:hypothetical protein
MLKQANIAEIDKSGYTLASAVKAMNADEDSQRLSLCLALRSNPQIALYVVVVNHILKTIGWLNLHPYL